MNPASSKPWVDSHFHVFAAHVAIPGARYVPAYTASMQAWQDMAAPAGVTRGVLVQPSFLGTDNHLLLDQLRRHPDDLRGVVVLDPGMDESGLAQWDAQGVRGLRLNLSGRSHRIEEWSGAAALWDAVLALGWHVELHTDPGALPQVLRQLPQHLPMVVDHMGKPMAVSPSDPTIACLAARARHCPVHVKLSGAYRLGGLDAGALARLWFDTLGPQSLLWGSDWPCTNHEDHAVYLHLLGSLHEWLPHQAVQLALSANPHALYWRD